MSPEAEALLVASGMAVVGFAIVYFINLCENWFPKDD